MKDHSINYRLIGAIAFVFIIAVYFASSIILLGGFKKIEVQAVHDDVHRAQDMVADDVSRIDSVARDWAWRNDTYAYAENRDPGYVKSNLNSETLNGMNIDAILFLNRSGEILYSKGFDEKIAKSAALPESAPSFLQPDSLLRRKNFERDGIKGLLLFRKDPMIIAARSIHADEGKGSSRGMLILGRYLDREERERLASMSRITLGIYRFDTQLSPSDIFAAHAVMEKNNPLDIAQIDANTIAGYGLVNDIYGRPALVLKIFHPRSIVRLGEKIIAYFFLWILGIIAALSVVIRVLRLRLLSAQKRGKALEDRYRILAENAWEGILLLDGKTQRILEANPSISRLTGYTESELFTLPFKERIAFYLDSIGQTFDDLKERDHDHPLELKINRKDGSSFDAEISFKRFMAGDRTLVSLVVRDVSERKRAESAKLEGVIQTVKTLHHEVSSPLQALTGSLELMKLGALNEREAKNCRRIEQASERIIDVLQRLGSLTEVATTDSPVGDRVLLPENPATPTYREYVR